MISPAGHGRHDDHLVAVGDRRGEAALKADVLVVQIERDESIRLARFIAQPRAQSGESSDHIAQRFADGAAARLERAGVAGQAREHGGQVHGDAHDEISTVDERPGSGGAFRSTALTVAPIGQGADTSVAAWTPRADQAAAMAAATWSARSTVATATTDDPEPLSVAPNAPNDRAAATTSSYHGMSERRDGTCNG